MPEPDAFDIQHLINNSHVEQHSSAGENGQTQEIASHSPSQHSTSITTQEPVDIMTERGQAIENASVTPEVEANQDTECAQINNGRESV